LNCPLNPGLILIRALRASAKLQRRLRIAIVRHSREAEILRSHPMAAKILSEFGALWLADFLGVQELAYASVA